jgi:hypothetical protein
MNKKIIIVIFLCICIILTIIGKNSYNNKISRSYASKIEQILYDAVENCGNDNPYKDIISDEDYKKIYELTRDDKLEEHKIESRCYYVNWKERFSITEAEVSYISKENGSNIELILVTEINDSKLKIVKVIGKWEDK